MTDGSDSLAAAGEETAAAQGEGGYEHADVVAAISACAAEKRSGCLLVWQDDVSDVGELFFADGWLIAATFGGAHGRAALTGILRTLPVVTARFFVGAAPERRTLDIAPRSVRPRLTALGAGASGAAGRSRQPAVLPAPTTTAAPQVPLVPSQDWQLVPSGTAVPPGGEYRLELGGKVYARWPDGVAPSSPPAPPAPPASPASPASPATTQTSRVRDAIKRLVPAPQATLPVLVGLMLATATVATVGAVLRPTPDGEEERLLNRVAMGPVPTRVGTTSVPASATATPRGGARVLPVSTFPPPAATFAVPTPWWSYDRPATDWAALTAAAPVPATLPDRWLPSSAGANFWLAPVTRPEASSPTTVTSEPPQSPVDSVRGEVVDQGPEGAGMTAEPPPDPESVLTSTGPVVLAAVDAARPEGPPAPVVAAAAVAVEPPDQTPAAIAQGPETAQPVPGRSDAVVDATPTSAPTTVPTTVPTVLPSPTVAPQATEEPQPQPTATAAATMTTVASATATPASTPTAAPTATPQPTATRVPSTAATPPAARTTTPQPAATTPPKTPGSSSGNGGASGGATTPPAPAKSNEGSKAGDGENPAKGGTTAPGKADDAKNGTKDAPKSDPKGEPAKAPDPGNSAKPKEDGNAKKDASDPGKSGQANGNKDGKDAKDAKS